MSIRSQIGASIANIKINAQERRVKTARANLARQQERLEELKAANAPTLALSKQIKQKAAELKDLEKALDAAALRKRNAAKKKK